jgi:1,4-dihydroxy-2-naphthoyl-CoA hydrolase
MTRIWHSHITVDMLNKRNEGTLSDHLDIVFTEIGDNFLTAHMLVAAHHLQPYGIMNGGASCVLAETVGSVGANCCVDSATHYCVGIDINTNHITGVPAGKELIALGRPFHLGRKTQVWSIDIRDDQDRLVSVSRLTVMVLQTLS